MLEIFSAERARRAGARVGGGLPLGGMMQREKGLFVPVRGLFERGKLPSVVSEDHHAAGFPL